MKANVIDTSTFPVRKVTSVRESNAQKPGWGISHFITLDCGHVVAVKVGFAVPDEAPCYRCDKEGKR